MPGRLGTSFIPIPGISTGEKIGSGAAGNVFKVTKGGRVLACKQFLTNANPFDRESHILERYSHPNVLHAIEIHRSTTEPLVTSILMPLCQTDLARFINEKLQGYIMSESCFEIVTSDLVKGLNYLHHNGIIHADLKSLNILIDSKCIVLLADFGHARIRPPNVRTTDFQVATFGTPATMAPEVLHCFMENVNNREMITFDGFSADRYSLGVVLYEMATGWLPYRNEVNVRDHLQRMLDIDRLYRDIVGQQNPLNDFHDNFPEPKQALIRNFLRIDPNERPQLIDILRLPWINRSYSTFSRERAILGLDLGTSLFKVVARFFKRS